MVASVSTAGETHELTGAGFCAIFCYINGRLLCKLTQSQEGNMFFSYTVGEAKSKIGLDFFTAWGHPKIWKEMNMYTLRTF